jgi:hypothetical protein
MDEHNLNNLENDKAKRNFTDNEEAKDFNSQPKELEKDIRPILPKIEVKLPKIKKTIVTPEVKKMEEKNFNSIEEYNKIQKIIAAIFYVIIVIASLVSFLGVVWTFADIFIGTTGKFELFLDLSLGYQIAIIAGLLAGLFFLLIFFFGLFKKSTRSLIKFIYRKRELEEKYKNRTDVKIAAGGLLICLIAIIIGVLFAIIQDVLTISSGGSSSLVDLFGSTGPWVLFVGIALFLVVFIALFMIYFWKNGYYLLLRLIGAIEKIDKEEKE